MDSKDRLARPERVEGLYVYVLSEPVDDYEVLGRIDRGTMASRRYEGFNIKNSEKIKRKIP